MPEVIGLKNTFRQEQPQRDTEAEKGIKPIGDRVFCYRTEEGEKILDGIVIPDAAQQKSQEAEVVAVGPGHMLPDGKLVPLSVTPGMKVILPKFGGTELEIKGVKYQIVHEKEIIAVIG